MNDTGKVIQELRMQAGFTQKSLADALHITDKAVSKWERGISLPDITLFPKLSLLLDVDMDILVSKSISHNEWSGLVEIQDCDFSQFVYDKPLVYYLLAHYLLLGITRIHILTNKQNQDYLSDEKFKKLGFEFCFCDPEANHLVVMNQPWFLFGSDLTRQFQGAMISGRNIKLVPENQEPVAYIACGDSSIKSMRNAASRTLGRGMICLKMDNHDRILDVASFVRTYQTNAGMLICSLEEIACKRGYIAFDQLPELLYGNVQYQQMVLESCKPKVG